MDYAVITVIRYLIRTMGNESFFLPFTIFHKGDKVRNNVTMEVFRVSLILVQRSELILQSSVDQKNHNADNCILLEQSNDKSVRSLFTLK